MLRAALSPSSMVTLVLLWLLCYVELVSATAAYIGCVSASSVSSGVLGNVVSLLAVSSASACATDCAQQSYTYSYYESGYGMVSSSCVCSNTGPAASSIVPSTTSAGACNSTTYSAMINTEPNSGQFTFGQCDSAWTNLDTGLSSTVTVPGTCFSNCIAYEYIFITPGASSYTCHCGNSYQAATAGICQSGNTMFYSQPASAASSTQVKVTSVSQGSTSKKRKLQMELEEKKRKLDPKRDFCPAGFKACRVRGSLDSFECIDTDSDLESCGGCIEYSEEGSDESIETLGTDCSALPGVALGAVTCALGQCEISRCSEGWRLVDGVCVETVSETWRREQVKRHEQQQKRRRRARITPMVIKHAVDKSIVR